jgi:hypothetical protein
MLKIQKSISEKITKGISKALIHSRAEAERRAEVYGTDRLLGFEKSKKN